LLQGDAVSVPNYSCIHRTNCRNQRNSEGVVVFKKLDCVNSILQFSIRKKSTDSGHFLFLQWCLDNVNLTTVYKSPKFSLRIFNEELEALLQKLSGLVIVFGDFNINLKSPEGNKLTELFQRYGLFSALVIGTPSTNQDTQIDLCFTNHPNVIAWYYESYYSYHKPICITWHVTC